MSKSPDAFRTISEVADWLGTPTHVLRFWESRFSQVKPVKRAGGRRYYRPADMALLGGIKKLLHDDGLTIRGVQKILREEGVKHVAAMSPSVDGAEAGETPNDVVPEPSADVPAQAVEPPSAPAQVSEQVSASASASIVVPESEPESEDVAVALDDTDESGQEVDGPSPVLNDADPASTTEFDTGGAARASEPDVFADTDTPPQRDVIPEPVNEPRADEDLSGAPVEPSLDDAIPEALPEPTRADVGAESQMDGGGISAVPEEAIEPPEETEPAWQDDLHESEAVENTPLVQKPVPTEQPSGSWRDDPNSVPSFLRSQDTEIEPQDTATPEPQPAPEKTPAPVASPRPDPVPTGPRVADEVLDLLADGARATPAQIAPIVTRLEALRERIATRT